MAKTYYVSTTGSDANTGTLASPWKTLSHGCATLSAGDTLYLRAGTYFDAGMNWSNGFLSGTAALPILIATYPADLPSRAVFNGQSAQTSFVTMVGCKYTIWRDLTIQNYGNQTTGVQSGSGLWFGYSGSGTDWSKGNKVQSCSFVAMGSQTNDHSIYFSYGNQDVEVSNCHFRGSPGASIHCWHAPGIQRGKIFNNLIFNTHWGIVMGEGLSAVEITNNLFADCDYGVDSSAGDENPVGTFDVKITNNIFRANNIFAIRNVVSTRMSAIANCYFGNAAIGLQGQSAILTDPKHKNYLTNGTGDYHLSAGSPCIAAGTSTYVVGAALALDKDGLARPTGTGIDIGPYEYTGDAAAPPPSTTVYFDLPNAVNGTGTSASPMNQTGFNARTKAAGDTYLFKRGTTSAATGFTLTSGTVGAVIKWGAWFNADGTDDVTQPKPIITTTTVLSAFNGTNANYVWLDNIKVVSSGFTVANDKALMWAGTGSTITNCVFDTNVGALGVWAKSSITVTDSSFSGVSHSNANNNCVLLVSSTNMDAIIFDNNSFIHYGGGGTSSHNCRLEADSGNTLTNLTFTSNIVTTSTNVANANLSALGVRLSNCPGCNIRDNDIRFHLEGIFCTASTSTIFNLVTNTCRSNSHFGIHLSTNAIACLVDGNDCSFNGTSTYNGTTLLAYGRGIECSSAAGQSKCSGHTIRFNTCNNNLNYGGPNDNGSEGVGIGLDDSTNNCLVYGNTCKNNEGNGIQQYGGSLGSGTPAITDTGGNSIIANYCENNCTAAIKNRRSGGTNTTLFNAHIALGSSIGSTAYVAHNVCVIGTPVAIAIDSSCDDIIIANNIMTSPHGISMDAGYSASVGVCNTNDFFGTTQLYSLRSVDVSGSATFASNPYVGTNDLTIDPKWTAAYSLSTGSAAIRAGFNIGTRLDALGRTYKNPPSLGMFEDFTNPPNAGGNLRKKLYHGH